jgi:hypothetical protein
LKQAVIAFPDVLHLVDFVLENELSKVETDSKERVVEGLFSDELIKKAEIEYQAQIVYMRSVD